MTAGMINDRENRANITGFDPVRQHKLELEPGYHRLHRGDMARGHKPDEWIGLDELQEASAMMDRLAEWVRRPVEANSIAPGGASKSIT
jgi:acetylornithine deacetylase/succinyl-diaminopimelate desuccinylase-like protein